MSLPKVQPQGGTPTTQDFISLQTLWAKSLNPVLAQPVISSNILNKVSLSIGSNNINHLLGRTLQGWFLVRKRGTGNIYDSQDLNQSPDLTLVLVSDAVVVVDILVF